MGVIAVDSVLVFVLVSFDAGDWLTACTAAVGGVLALIAHGGEPSLVSPVLFLVGLVVGAGVATAGLAVRR